MAMKKPVKKVAKSSSRKPPKGARYLTQAESKAASKGSGYKTKDVKYNDERKTRPGRQGMYSGDIDAKGRDIMVYGGPTGFGQTAPRKSNPKAGASQRGGIGYKKPEIQNYKQKVPKWIEINENNRRRLNPKKK